MIEARIINILKYLIAYAVCDCIISIKYGFTKNFENDEKLFFIWFDILIFFLSDIIGAVILQCYYQFYRQKKKSNIPTYEKEGVINLIFYLLEVAVIETIVKFLDIFLFKYAENGIVKEYGMAWYIGFDYFMRIIYYKCINRKEVYIHQKFTSILLILISLLLFSFYIFLMENIFNQSLSLVQFSVITLKILLIPLEDSIIQKIMDKLPITVKILFARGIVSLFLFTIFSILMFQFKFIEWANIFSWEGILFLIFWPFLYSLRSISLIYWIYNGNFTYITSFKFPLLIRNYLIFKDNYNNMYLHLFYILYFIIILFFILIIIEIASLNFCGLSKFNALEIMRRGEQDTHFYVRNPSDFSVIPGEQGNKEQEEKEQEDKEQEDIEQEDKEQENI